MKDAIKISNYHVNNRFKNSQIALIIDGKALNFILSFECKKEFLELAIACKTAICCRATPRNKAQIVDLIKKHTRSITLAIGDGANDVSMIQVKILKRNFSYSLTFEKIGCSCWSWYIRKRGNTSSFSF